MAVGDYIQAKLVSFTQAEVAQLASAAEDEWASTLKVMRSTILNNILSKIPDQATFEKIMLERQLPAYQQFINPAHPKAAKALAKLKAKWQDLKTYQEWYNEIQNAFSEGGKFEASIDKAAQDNKYESRVIAVLMAVGGSPLGPSLAPKLVMILRNLDPTPYLRTDLGETYEDTGVDKPINDPALPDYVAGAVVPVLVEGIYWHQAYSAVGDTKSADEALQNTQSRLQALIDKILDAARFKLTSLALAYDETTGRYTLDIRIDQTA